MTPYRLTCVRLPCPRSYTCNTHSETSAKTNRNRPMFASTAFLGRWARLTTGTAEVDREDDAPRLDAERGATPRLPPLTPLGVPRELPPLWANGSGPLATAVSDLDRACACARLAVPPPRAREADADKLRPRVEIRDPRPRGAVAVRGAPCEDCKPSVPPPTHRREWM
jgi:hypothetical protein